MLQKLNATRIGLLTGIIMIGLTLGFFYAGMESGSLVQYSIYIVYAAGIALTIFLYSKSEQNSGRYGSYFQEGFKCFVVATLLMVIYTFVFNKMHPEFTDKIAVVYKERLIRQGNATPPEIESNVSAMKKSYLTILIAASIFQYLIIGVVVTLVSSFLFMKRK